MNSDLFSFRFPISLTQLQILQLQYNDIQSIGSGLGYLTRLQTLRLDSNPITSIRADELNKLVQLKIFDVSDSSLDNLDVRKRNNVVVLFLSLIFSVRSSYFSSSIPSDPLLNCE